MVEVNNNLHRFRGHSVRVTPQPGLPKTHTDNKFNPVWGFGNIDNPVPPAGYKPDDKHRVLKWHCRNPFHNFDHYVIGVNSCGAADTRSEIPVRPAAGILRWPGANWFCFRSFPASGAVLTFTSAGANTAVLE